MKRAFSIFEVLVVILIIMIIASLLFPVFSSSKNATKRTVCISNIHQLYAGLKLYQADHDSYPPNSQAWPGLQSYTKTTFKCPASEDRVGVFDYILNGSMFGNGRESRSLAWLDCREKLESKFPLVFDINHLSVRKVGSDDNKFVIVGREDGSVKSIKPPTQVPTQPCSTSVLGPYINL